MYVYGCLVSMWEHAWEASTATADVYSISDLSYDTTTAIINEIY